MFNEKVSSRFPFFKTVDIKQVIYLSAFNVQHEGNYDSRNC